LLSPARSATEWLFFFEIFVIEQPLELITLQDSIKVFAQSRAVCSMLDCCHHVCVLSTTLFKHPAFVRLFIGFVMIKGNVHPITDHEGPEGEQMYSCTLPLTFALEGGGWATPHPGRFTPPVKDPVGDSQGQAQKISPPTGIPSLDHPACSKSLY